MIIPNDSIRYLALGDSYTIGESVAEDDRWPVQLRDSLIQLGHPFSEFKIIARTGWITTNLLFDLNNKQISNNWNMVSLLIGVNNQYQNRPFDIFMQELPELINRAISYAGNDTLKVFLLSIPDYAYTPFGVSTGNTFQISSDIDQYNAAIYSIANMYGIPFFISPILPGKV